jgi:hypothetical protein
VEILPGCPVDALTIGLLAGVTGMAGFAIYNAVDVIICKKRKNAKVATSKPGGV